MAAALVTILIIAFLTLFGLILAERGREKLPARPLNAAGEALTILAGYLIDPPVSYTWHKVEIPALDLTLTALGHSAGLLALSLGLAVLVGVPLGLFAAYRRAGSVLMLLSVLGVSLPSFLLAMLLWVLNFQLHRSLGVRALPPTGFGWDAHLVMPALVLATRPLAQIAQVTYVSFSEVFSMEFIRTARAKGLTARMLQMRHALPNVWIPVLTTLGASLRFSLASLPVVEFFFIWPGVGLTLLEAIGLGMLPLVTDLIVSLGLVFLGVNLALELLSPRLDPRFRMDAQEPREPYGWREGLDGLRELVDGLLSDLQALWKKLAGRSAIHRAGQSEPVAKPAGLPAGAAFHRRRSPLSLALTNPAFILGGLMVMALVILALLGPQLSSASPYETHGVMIVAGKIGAPPFNPSPVFPWGTDHLGRDIQALVLAGARQTFSLALLGMIARVALGGLLGLLAGWRPGSWLDRLVTAVIGVWAAFPSTLFAMILIQAIGIQKGMPVFILAICVIGWGEVAQFVRAQVMRIRPQLFIEAARSTGARPLYLLTRHVAANMLDSFLVLAVLEMGGVMMLLAELGFLNVFLGGGFKVAYAEKERMVPLIAYFSDIPEWGALLANIRDWWRSYPWMAWYPGLAFFLAIIAFNVFGEGLRRFLAESRLNLNRLFNRFSLLAVIGISLALAWTLRSTSPLGVYSREAQAFDTGQAMNYIWALTRPSLAGREPGQPGARLAAEYIAGEMEAIGLFPGGSKGSYFLTEPRTLPYLAELPRLVLLDSEGRESEALVYRRDFVEAAGPFQTFGEAEGQIVGLALGLNPDSTAPDDTLGVQGATISSLGTLLRGKDPYGLRNYNLSDKIVIVRQAEIGRLNLNAVAGVLVVSEDLSFLQKKYLYNQDLLPREKSPVMLITPQTADRLLRSAGSSLADMYAVSEQVEPGQIAMTAPGSRARLRITLAAEFNFSLPPEQIKFSDCYHLIGYLPGAGAEMGAGKDGASLDRQVVMVSAFYDGVGAGLDGVLYPGANDNASGVAVMLELARALKNSPYAPKKTVMFVAWDGGNRYETLNLNKIMNAGQGFNQLKVESVIELGGVGSGSGDALALGENSSFRLVHVFQDAATRVDTEVTTRGQLLHSRLYAQPETGGRQALTAYLSWDGADLLAHTPEDSFESIDPEKIAQSGQTTLLAVTMLSRETEY